MMKKITVALVFHCLIACWVSGQFPNPPFPEIRKISLMKPNRREAILFLKGYASGLDESIDFSSLEPCIHNKIQLEVHIATAINFFQSQSPEGIDTAVQQIGHVASIIPIVIQSCKSPVLDHRTIAEMVKAFNNPGKFVWEVNATLKVHGIDIWPEVQQGVNYYNELNFFRSGESFGLAVSKVFFSQIKASSKAMVKFLNTIPKLWQAAHYPQFENLTLWEAKKQLLGLGSFQITPDIPIDVEEVKKERLREHFDSRERWGDCIHEIRNQGQCGSSWAFGATEVLSDRLCIATEGKINHDLSPQRLISCDKLNNGCQGGILSHAWWYLVRKGTITEGCWPFESGEGAQPSCERFSVCKDGSIPKFYRVQHGSVKHFLGSGSIKREIFEHGPVQTGFMVFEDFLLYKSGIYNWIGGKYIGNHAAKIIGWGIEKGIKYWIVANSWSHEWGEGGYFRIREGECFIDYGPIAGLPELV